MGGFLKSILAGVLIGSIPGWLSRHDIWSAVSAFWHWMNAAGNMPRWSFVVMVFSGIVLLRLVQVTANGEFSTRLKPDEETVFRRLVAKGGVWDNKEFCGDVGMSQLRLDYHLSKLRKRGLIESSGKLTSRGRDYAVERGWDRGAEEKDRVQG